ncbi:MAG: phenylalanine--tRNA ligase subunit alpha, partial [Bdellovibrionales bacterium]|nr:phenylalanine--tRNA ligase subunit alpha [Bdellovibrionales bacterium]
MLSEKVKAIHQEAAAAFAAAKETKELYDLKVKFLGKQGQLSLVMREMGQLPKEEKPAFGKMVNEVKVALEDLYSKMEVELGRAELNQRIAGETLDLTLPGPARERGGRHPIQKVINEIVEILGRIGYSVRTGPMIEKDWYNFEALNIPPDHPA